MARAGEPRPQHHRELGDRRATVLLDDDSHARLGRAAGIPTAGAILPARVRARSRPRRAPDDARGPRDRAVELAPAFGSAALLLLRAAPRPRLDRDPDMDGNR